MKGKFRVFRNTSKKNIKKLNDNIRKPKKHKPRIETTQIGEVKSVFSFENNKLVDFKRETFSGRYEVQNENKASGSEADYDYTKSGRIM